MRKLLKNTAITLVAGFALLGAGGTAMASANYFNWNGTSSYENTLETFKQIGTKFAESKVELANVNRENEQLTNAVKDKENVIVAEKQKSDALKKENDKLKELSTKDENELKQAEIDFKDVESKAKDLLNGME